MDSGHLTESEIAAYVDRQLSAGERAHVEAHLYACASCRAEVVDAVRTIDALGLDGGRDADVSPVTNERAAGDIAVALPAVAERTGVRPITWRRAGYGAAAAMAAAIAGVLLLRSPTPPTAPVPSAAVVRSASTSAEADQSLIPLAPAADASVTEAGLRFAWRGAPAEAYRVTLLTESGEPIWSEEVTDTVVALPAQVQLQHGATYFWRVDAIAVGRAATSGVRRFRVSP